MKAELILDSISIPHGSNIQNLSQSHDETMLLLVHTTKLLLGRVFISETLDYYSIYWPDTAGRKADGPEHFTDILKQYEQELRHG